MANVLRFSAGLLPFACSLLLLFSCTPKTDYKQEISRLDSAETILTRVQNALDSLDLTSLHAAYDAPAKELQAISQKLQKDTIKKQTGLFLLNAIEQSGNIRNLLDNQKFLERAVRESRQRISDLKHDLEADLIEKNKSAEYVVNEVTSSCKIAEAVDRATGRAKIAVTKLDSMKIQITALADSLAAK